MKCCRDCGREKSLEEFYSTKNGIFPYCKLCSLVRSSLWQKSNREKKRVNSRKHYFNNKGSVISKVRKYQSLHPAVCIKAGRKWYLKRYNLTEEIYQKILLLQNNQCAICQKETPGKLLHVDHNHSSGKIRGLLCAKCNAGLGLFADSSILLQKASTYLREDGLALNRLEAALKQVLQGKEPPIK